MNVNMAERLQPKPTLARSQRVRKSDPSEVDYSADLDKWVQVQMSADQFLAWFPKRVRADFAAWRRAHLDTTQGEAGLEWRAFPVDPGYVWLRVPALRRQEQDGISVLIMEGEHLVKVPEGHTNGILPIELVKGNWQGISLGPAFWFEVYPQGQLCEVRAICIDVLASEPAVVSYFEALCGMLSGSPLAYNNELSSSLGPLEAWLAVPYPRRRGQQPVEKHKRLGLVYLFHNDPVGRSREDFCATLGISRSSLAAYERELEEAGIAVSRGMGLPSKVLEALRTLFPNQHAWSLDQ